VIGRCLPAAVHSAVGHRGRSDVLSLGQTGTLTSRRAPVGRTCPGECRVRAHRTWHPAETVIVVASVRHRSNVADHLASLSRMSVSGRGSSPASGRRLRTVTVLGTMRVTVRDRRRDLRGEARGSKTGLRRTGRPAGTSTEPSSRGTPIPFPGQGAGWRGDGMEGRPRQDARHRADDSPRPGLRRLAAELDDLLHTVAEVRASRLRQLADARSARRGPAAPGSPDPSSRARARPDP
jgi:hypothetical protein